MPRSNPNPLEHHRRHTRHAVGRHGFGVKHMTHTHLNTDGTLFSIPSPTSTTLCQYTTLCIYTTLAGRTRGRSGPVC
jgi:hypothetical protein